MIKISRRRFLALSGGLLATGCTSGSRSSASPTTTGIAPDSTGLPPAGSAPTTTIPSIVTTVLVPPELVPDDRVLVIVELAGGNDAVNTLPPLSGPYRSLRPTLALPESELLASSMLPDHALHPALDPLVPMLDEGRLAVLAGIGFPDPDRSHFVSIDRWTRADRMDEQLGWLGRWLDRLPADPPALGATALGNNGRILLGADRHGTVIDGVDAFAFPTGLGNSSIRALTEPIADDPLLAAAQRTYLASVGATEEFDVIADAVRARVATPDGDDIAPPGGGFSTGLAVAAELVVGDVGTRVVTVAGGGFDTHSDQLTTHSDLLADLAAGLTAFWDVVDAAGMGDRVLLATHSEFGRRVAENASGGCDHGAGGVSLLMGTSVAAGLHGAIDLTDLLDGDLRPTIDPHTMFTACLDWLGADVEAILGGRSDQLELLV